MTTKVTKDMATFGKTFLGLDDVETGIDYGDHIDHIVSVNDTGDGLTLRSAGSFSGATSFTGLTDTPSSYTGANGKWVKVSGMTLVFEDLPTTPQAFTDLTDVPSSFAGFAGSVPVVNSTEDGLEFLDLPSIPLKFVELTDTPGTLSGQGGKTVKVNSAGTALEFVLEAPVEVPTTFVELTDCPSTIQNGKFLRGNTSVSPAKLEWASAPGVTTFLGLSDTPSSYSGANGKYVTVLTSGGTSSLVFTSLPAIPSSVSQLAGIDFAGGTVGQWARLASGDTIEFADAPTSGGAGASALVVAVSSETAVISTGSAKVTFRMPYDMEVGEIRASLTTASSSGTVGVNVRKNGTTVFSTALTIDASETTSVTAATPAVLSSTTWADNDEIKVDIDSAGTGAIGLKIYIIPA